MAERFKAPVLLNRLGRVGHMPNPLWPMRPIILSSPTIVFDLPLFLAVPLALPWLDAPGLRRIAAMTEGGLAIELARGGASLHPANGT